MVKEVPQRKRAVEQLRRQFCTEVTVRLIICLSHQQSHSDLTLGVILLSLFLSPVICS